MANTRSAGIESSHAPKCQRGWLRNSFALRLCTKSMAAVVWMTLSCGTPHAILQITAPPTATAGTPFTITVTATYQGNPDTAINSFVHFTSSDSAAILPADYLFTKADAGSHTFPNGVTLKTPGNQTITAAVNMATGINGTAQVTVSSGNLASAVTTWPATSRQW